ncbi:MAG TPA: hypothetical protein VM326_01980, partial [Sphingomicrobium sp.]|nr:hypothetical protein [Sphingomicrobium sp.]
STSGTTVKVAAFDDPGGNNVVGDGVLDTITSIAISYGGGPATLITTSGNYVVSGKAYTVTFNVDGTVNVAGVVGDSGSSQIGTRVAAYTDNGYNSLSFTYVSGNTFKIGDFGAAVQSTDPVLFSLPMQIVDRDGDVLAGGNINVTLTPPVVLDMNGDGVVSFLDRSANVAYDYNNDGVAEATAWVASGDGILVRDANGDGTVTDASEFVFGGDGVTDMEALRAQYGDTLDADDADFAKFMVWVDANSNGSVDAGELQSLAEAGITSISLVSDGVSYTAANGDVYVAGAGTYTRADGSIGVAADAMFASSDSKTTQEVERVAANSNTLTIAAALAAAGLGSAAAATEPGFAAAVDGSANSAVSMLASAGGSEGLSTNSGPAFDLVGDLDGGVEVALQAMASSSATAIAASQIGELTVPAPAEEGPAALLDATDLSPMLQMPAATNGMAVVQEVAPIAGEADGTVGKIVADALEGGEASPSIDALLAALPSAGLGENAGPDSLASPIADSVPTWDTGHAGAFTNGAAGIITSEAAVLHHDAVQPV